MVHCCPTPERSGPKQALARTLPQPQPQPHTQTQAQTNRTLNLFWVLIFRFKIVRFNGLVWSGQSQLAMGRPDWSTGRLVDWSTGLVAWSSGLILGRLLFLKLRCCFLHIYFKTALLAAHDISIDKIFKDSIAQRLAPRLTYIGYAIK